MPQILSVGPAFEGFVIAALSLPVARATIDDPVPIGIVAETATGYTGRPGLCGARHDGTAWAPRFTLTEVERRGDAGVTYRLDDEIAALRLMLVLDVGDVFTICASVENRADTSYMLERLAPSVPLPAHASDLQTFTGRWCREFQPQRLRFEGTTLVENRTGRTSHAQMPAMFTGTDGFAEQHGEVWGVQLAWSGNYALSAERIPDGRRHIQAGELLEPFEIELEPGETYTAPDVVVAWADTGLSATSRCFHRAIRADLSPDRRPRPVILNTWEAVYFDHRLDTLQQLADVAAEVGVERFVLDDGWFGGRRDDTAGLGDWWVSDAAWPSGLTPIVDHVTGLGMEFGLWVEPEMVNPDSELYRTHPDWTLTTDGYEPVFGRHQLVLDLGRPEVGEFLFDALDALLTEYDISYLKWDMNREVVQGSRGGRSGAHAHVLGVYDLMERLIAAHRGLEIESCASGGGRADMGILRRTDRIWTSDCNDALERQLIQRGFTMLFPAEVMGAHIGPERAHTTHRRHDLGFRAATALFGHLGIEWNLLTANGDERKQVAATVEQYKRLRSLLHEGRVERVDHPDPAALVHGVVSDDRSHAVFAYVQMTPSATTAPAPMRFPGLEPGRRYRVSVIDSLGATKPFGRAQPSWITECPSMSGRQLVTSGLQMPIQHPESIVLVELGAAT